MAMRVSGWILGRNGLVMAAVAMPMPALAQSPQISGDLLEFYRSMQGAQWATAQGNASETVCTFTVVDRVESDCMVKLGTNASQMRVKLVYLADGSTETWVDGKNINAGGVAFDRRNQSYFRNGVFFDTALHTAASKSQTVSTSLKLSEDMMVSISRTTQGSVVTNNVSYQVRVVNGDVAGAMARSRDAAAALGATTNAQRILEMLKANPAAFMGDAPDRLRPLVGLIPGLAQDQAPVVAQPQPQQQPQVLPPKPTVATVTPARRPATSVTPPSIQAQKMAPRFALVIGNARYGGSLAPLANPVRDADLVAGALRATGFQVEVLRDADQRGMKAAIARFGQRMRGAGAAGTGLFYYAGHGAQARGVNYLIPVNAQLTTEADLDLDGVSADAVLSQMSEAGVGTSIVILDACRNLPLARGTRSADRGLARMDAPGGSYIAYSTAPGQTAADGAGANSPFASALVREIAKADEPIEILFRNVRSAVYEATAGRQTPWDSSSLFRSFVFTPGAH